MTPTERQRIEHDAIIKYGTPRGELHVGYIAGALAEHDKARNQAIDEAINWLKSEIENEDYVQGDNYDKHSYGRACAFNDAIEHLESLKTIS